MRILYLALERVCASACAFAFEFAFACAYACAYVKYIYLSASVYLLLLFLVFSPVIPLEIIPTIHILPKYLNVF